MSKFIKKILKEASFSFDDIIALIPDLGKEIGSQTNGIVYERYGKALKITMNLEDASLGFLIKQKCPKHFTTIFSVEEVYLNERPTGIYLIEREYLSQLSKDEHSILSDFAYIIERYVESKENWNDSQFLSISGTFSFDLVRKLHKEFKALFFELSKFKMYDLGPSNLGRKKDGTLAAYDAETNISFPDSYKQFDKFYLDTLNENVKKMNNHTKKIIRVLKELDDANSPAMPDIMPNEFTEYMAEATDESMTMEIGAIPNSLDESKLKKALEWLEEKVDKEKNKKKLFEVGDLNNIQPYSNDDIYEKDNGFVYRIIDQKNKLVVDIFFEELKEEKNIAKREIFKSYKLQSTPSDLYVNLGFTVNDSEVQGKKTNLSLYYKILKTIVEITKEFISQKKPVGIIIGSREKETSKIKNWIYGQAIKNFLSTFKQYILIEYNLYGENYKLLVDKSRLLKKELV